MRVAEGATGAANALRMRSLLPPRKNRRRLLSSVVVVDDDDDKKKKKAFENQRLAGKCRASRATAPRPEAPACPSAIYAAGERSSETSPEATRRARSCWEGGATPRLAKKQLLTETATAAAAAAPLASHTTATTAATTTSTASTITTITTPSRTSASIATAATPSTSASSTPPHHHDFLLSLRRRLLLRSPSASHPSAAAAAAHSRLLAASLGLLSALADAPEALAATTAAAAATAASAATTAAAVTVAATTAAAAVTAAATAAASSSTAAVSTFVVAEGGPLPPALLEALSSFLAAVEDMGPAGAGVFAATVALAELVPLLPTTPLALASGLLFGAAKGAALVIAGNLVAATAAFYIARGVGARFAQRVVAAEGGGGHSDGDGEREEEATATAAPSSPAAGLAARFASVTAAIEKGTAAQKFAAVFALRATPVVPFSASNYVLGLSPISFPVYFTATALGGSIWASVYASLGAASRALLARGAAIDVLVADLLEQATSVADDTATGLVLLSVGAAAGWGLALAAKSRGGKEGEGGGGGGEEQQEAAAAAAGVSGSGSGKGEDSQPRSKAAQGGGGGARMKGGSSSSSGASRKGLEALK